MILLFRSFHFSFLVFGSLLAKKSREFKNIMKSLFTFCMARWARQKKWKENHPGSLLEGRAEILEIFGWYFGMTEKGNLSKLHSK